MAFDFTLRTQESSYLPTNAPSADNIYNALSSVQLPEGTNWVGPLAKIDRYKPAHSLSFITEVTWVFEVQGLYAANASQAQQTANQVAASVDQALARLSSDWSRATMSPYDASTEGPLSGWQSGQSAVPRYDSAGLDQVENAAVVTQQAASQATQDVSAFAARAGQSVASGVSGLLSPLNQSAGNLLKLAAIGGAVLLVAVTVPYLLAGRSAVRAVRRNPRFVDGML